MSMQPKTIEQKLDDIRERVKEPTFSKLLSAAAVKAILGGKTSPAWTEYMELVVGHNAPRQLARLTFKKGVDDKSDALIKSCAYIVANGTCGVETQGHTRQGVDVQAIDEGLADGEP